LQFQFVDSSAKIPCRMPHQTAAELQTVIRWPVLSEKYYVK